MKRLVILVVAAMLLWSGYWFWQARALRADTAAWFDTRRAEGWTASYGTLSVRGFPNRLDLTVEDIALAAPDGGPAWDAPFFQILRLVYQPDHVILAFADEQRLSVDGRDYAITSDGLRASLVTEGREILRANLEAPVLNVAGPERATALAGVTAALHRVEALERSYRIGLNAEAAAMGQGRALPRPVTVDGMQMQAEVVFDREWSLRALDGPRPQPERIDLRLAEYRIEGLDLKLTGALDVDPAGRADGTLSVRAENWRETLAAARTAGTLPDWLSDALVDGLGLLSQLSGRADTLDLTLRLRDGQMSAGLVPLGPAPLIRLP